MIFRISIQDHCVTKKTRVRLNELLNDKIMRDGSGDNKSRRELIREVVRICRKKTVEIDNNGRIRLKRNVGEHS